MEVESSSSSKDDVESLPPHWVHFNRVRLHPSDHAAAAVLRHLSVSFDFDPAIERGNPHAVGAAERTASENYIASRFMKSYRTAVTRRETAPNDKAPFRIVIIDPRSNEIANWKKTFPHEVCLVQGHRVAHHPGDDARDRPVSIASGLLDTKLFVMNQCLYYRDPIELLQLLRVDESRAIRAKWNGMPTGIRVVAALHNFRCSGEQGLLIHRYRFPKATRNVDGETVKIPAVDYTEGWARAWTDDKGLNVHYIDSYQTTLASYGNTYTHLWRCDKFFTHRCFVEEYKGNYYYFDIHHETAVGFTQVMTINIRLATADDRDVAIAPSYGPYVVVDGILASPELRTYWSKRLVSLNLTTRQGVALLVGQSNLMLEGHYKPIIEFVPGDVWQAISKAHDALILDCSRGALPAVASDLHESVREMIFSKRSDELKAAFPYLPEIVCKAFASAEKSDSRMEQMGYFGQAIWSGLGALFTRIVDFFKGLFRREPPVVPSGNSSYESISEEEGSLNIVSLILKALGWVDWITARSKVLDPLVRIFKTYKERAYWATHLVEFLYLFLSAGAEELIKRMGVFPIVAVIWALVESGITVAIEMRKPKDKRDWAAVVASGVVRVALHVVMAALPLPVAIAVHTVWNVWRRYASGRSWADRLWQRVFPAGVGIELSATPFSDSSPQGRVPLNDGVSRYEVDLDLNLMALLAEAIDNGRSRMLAQDTFVNVLRRDFLSGVNVYLQRLSIQPRFASPDYTAWQANPVPNSGSEIVPWTFDELLTYVSRQPWPTGKKLMYQQVIFSFVEMTNKVDYNSEIFVKIDEKLKDRGGGEFAFTHMSKVRPIYPVSSYDIISMRYSLPFAIWLNRSFIYRVEEGRLVFLTAVPHEELIHELMAMPHAKMAVFCPLLSPNAVVLSELMTSLIEFAPTLVGRSVIATLVHGDDCRDCYFSAKRVTCRASDLVSCDLSARIPFHKGFFLPLLGRLCPDFSDDLYVYGENGEAYFKSQARTFKIKHPLAAIEVEVPASDAHTTTGSCWTTSSNCCYQWKVWMEWAPLADGSEESYRRKFELCAAHGQDVEPEPLGGNSSQTFLGGIFTEQGYWLSNSVLKKYLHITLKENREVNLSDFGVKEYLSALRCDPELVSSPLTRAIKDWLIRMTPDIDEEEAWHHRRVLLDRLNWYVVETYMVSRDDADRVPEVDEAEYVNAIKDYLSSRGLWVRLEYEEAYTELMLWDKNSLLSAATAKFLFLLRFGEGPRPSLYL